MRASCWVIVLAPSRYRRLPRRLDTSAPTIRIGSTPGMLVEAPVLDREHRLHHARRNRGERHLPPLLAARAQEGGEERRVERDAVGGLAARLDRADAARRGGSAAGLSHARLFEHDAHGLRPWRLPPRGMTDNGAGADGELAGLLDAGPLRVAEIVQPVDDLGGAERLALAQLERPREDTRQHAFALAVQARVDLPREGHVVVAEDRRQHNRWQRERDDDVLHPAPTLAPAGSRSRRTFSSRK